MGSPVPLNQPAQWEIWSIIKNHSTWNFCGFRNDQSLIGVPSFSEFGLPILAIVSNTDRQVERQKTRTSIHYKWQNGNIRRLPDCCKRRRYFGYQADSKICDFLGHSHIKLVIVVEDYSYNREKYLKIMILGILFLCSLISYSAKFTRMRKNCYDFHNLKDCMNVFNVKEKKIVNIQQSWFFFFFF